MSLRSSRRLSKSQYSLRETEGSARDNLLDSQGYRKICAPTTYKTIYDSATPKGCLKAPGSCEEISNFGISGRRTEYVYDDSHNSNVLLSESGGQGGFRKSKRVTYAPVASVNNYSYASGHSYQNQAAVNDADVYTSQNDITQASYGFNAGSNSAQYSQHTSGQSGSYSSGSGSSTGSGYSYSGSGGQNFNSQTSSGANYSTNVSYGQSNGNSYSGYRAPSNTYSQGATVVNSGNSIANNTIRSSIFDGEVQASPIVVQRTETDTESESEEEYEANDTFNENAYGNKYIQQNYTVGTSPANIKPLDGYSLVKQPSLDFSKLNLPPPNLNCFLNSPPPKSVTRVIKHPQVVVNKQINQNYETTKTFVNDNVTHHFHDKKVVINVNRNHWHTQRIIVKDNNYHHFLINNIIRINDIHHQKIEKVRGEGKTFRDYKQTQRIEQPGCQTGQQNLTPVEIGANTYASNGAASSVGAAVNASVGASLDANTSSGAVSGASYNVSSGGYTSSSGVATGAALSSGRASAVIESSASTDSNASVSRIVKQARAMSQDVNYSNNSATASASAPASVSVQAPAYNEPITSRQYFTHDATNSDSGAYSSSNNNQYSGQASTYRRGNYVPYRGQSQSSGFNEQPNGEYIAKIFRQPNKDNYGSSSNNYSNNNNNSYSYGSYGGEQD